jgi:hypothetical protein
MKIAQALANSKKTNSKGEQMSKEEMLAEYIGKSVKGNYKQHLAPEISGPKQLNNLKKILENQLYGDHNPEKKKIKELAKEIMKMGLEKQKGL